MKFFEVLNTLFMEMNTLPVNTFFLGMANQGMCTSYLYYLKLC
jgi:hypothetical protein